MPRPSDSGPPPADLAALPWINEFLARLGLGALAAGAVRRHAGRHSNWAGRTDTGVEVFVKRVGGDSPDPAAQFRRLVDLESVRRTVGDPVPMPRCLGWAEDTRLIVFERLVPARDGAELADDGDFDAGTAATVGRLVARLHRATVPLLDTSPPRFPPTVELVALPLPVFTAASGAELELWRLLQQDSALVAALRDLRAAEARVPLAPTHCDLRLDQLVRSGGRVHLTDWDELRRADPARDVGAFVGEWLYRATLRIVADGDGDGELGHATVLDRAEVEFGAVRPLITAFWRAYRTARPPEAGFVARVAGYVGWHQLERLLAAAGERARLLPIERASAGIARSILLAPDRFAPTMGLDLAEEPDDDTAVR